MLRLRLALLCLITALAAPAHAEGWSRIGHGRLTVNDVIGDRYDRWRTGSVVASHVFAQGWDGHAPALPGQLLEFRIMGEIIAPRRLDTPSPDRPYTQAISLGLHTHVQHGGWQMALGADAVITGPQTGLSDLQMGLHRVAQFDHRISPAVAASQTPNGLHGSAVFELGRELTLGPATLRPFTEVRAGVEDLVRVGFDLSVGTVGREELLVRDPVTGHRYRAVTRPDPGYALVLGADIAKVNESLYLPAATHSLSDARIRARTGVHWQRDRWGGFYGLTWLGPEFQGQASGQVVGAMRIQVRF